MPEGPAPTPEVGFAEFRSIYPRREAWGRAEKAYQALWKAGKLPAAVILRVAIKMQQRPGGCLHRVVSKEGRDMRPLPASWLYAKRWHDELEPPLKETADAVLGQTRWTDEDRQRAAAKPLSNEQLRQLREDEEFLARDKFLRESRQATKDAQEAQELIKALKSPKGP
jgi:hypothetical protein